MSVTAKNCDITYAIGKDTKIPAVALGTWKAAPNEVYTAVLEALKAGYRHIDGAAIYCNEEEVGKAIRDSGIPRKDIFVTTKLWGTEQRNPLRALDSSLKRLGLDYVDLYLMHWPVALKADSITDNDLLTIPKLPSGKTDIDIENWNFIKTWELMQELPTSKAKAIGVSNFSINNLNELLAAPTTKTIPAANQFEIHPLLPQNELIKYCQDKKIIVEAYCPLGGSNVPLVTNPVITEIATKLGVNAGQLLISWGIQRGYVVLPKSVRKERIVTNFQTITIPAEEFEKMNNLTKEFGVQRSVNIDFSPFPTYQ
ncbi:hypothetical protein TPHA_0G00210 [Tetrapisispora phaffii CBS 4417]|uniref:NADP-dependent oxidoreductase domain-containing protein n=1 Tax=Tetrapisispora phaffii (strain ATCC 24235 / CBS 4417 / NBRC 1672 / NRRL Y-8282 / UCD 70-5) TaxID=1071381 RepID=G8BVD1_TETPH|nr:hypothetical protein TPHA_0G00210 [Tetrapisispora phaffii CBS 4417]CCE63859.1 hypothetical protein TPHA_0G00210 [Tetrapisispora phaffii CBS 4417]